MFGITNWKTSLAGLISIVAAGLSANPKFAPYTSIISMLASGATGLLAKDKNVTGGSISNITGATAITPVSLVDEGPTK